MESKNESDYILGKIRKDIVVNYPSFTDYAHNNFKLNETRGALLRIGGYKPALAIQALVICNNILNHTPDNSEYSPYLIYCMALGITEEERTARIKQWKKEYNLRHSTSCTG